MVNLLGLVEREAKVLGSAFADLARRSCILSKPRTDD